MIAVSGLSDSDPRAVHRREVCQFIDDRSVAGGKALRSCASSRRDMAESPHVSGPHRGPVRLSRREASARIRRSSRRSPRSRWTPSRATGSCASPRTPTFPRCRARMIQLAEKLGWLSPSDHACGADAHDPVISRAAQMPSVPAEVDLVCALNKDRALDRERHRLSLSPEGRDARRQRGGAGMPGSDEGARAYPAGADRRQRRRGQARQKCSFRGSADRRRRRVARCCERNRAHDRVVRAGPRARHASGVIA